MEKDEIELQVESARWLLDEINELLTEYKQCKTGYRRRKLLLKIENLRGRLKFESREMKKLII